MIIIDKKTITSVRKWFRPLMRSFNGLDYSVGVSAKTFLIEETSWQEENFTLSNLIELFSEADSEIEGTVIPITFKELQTIVKKNLCYQATFDRGVIESTDIIFIEVRSDAFWLLIEQFITIPPQRSFLHIPNSGSYFGNGVIWDFCFILLHENNGLVVTANASD